MLDLAEREFACVATLDLDFDTMAAASGFAKQTLALISRDPGAFYCIRAGGAELMINLPCRRREGPRRREHRRRVVQAVTAPRQPGKERQSAHQVCRCSYPSLRCRELTSFLASLVRKLLRRLDDLVSNSSALSMEHAQGFETLAFNSTAISSAAAKVRLFRQCSVCIRSFFHFRLAARLRHLRLLLGRTLDQATFRPLCSSGFGARRRRERAGQADATSVRGGERTARSTRAGCYDDFGYVVGLRPCCQA